MKDAFASANDLVNRPFSLRTALALLAFTCSLLSHAQLIAQQSSIPSSNVNVISGTGADGDWTLQRQNEPSGACSSRNSQNCLVGANDYRSVDIPFPNDAGRVIGDAWLGWYTTKDGGQTWRTRLLPGFPQDTSADGVASPLKGTEAGADPVVRSGAFGMLFYSGIAFNRSPGGGSRVFVARFIDNNDRERPDVESIAYLDTKVVQSAPNGTVTNFFVDKPWLAVDVPREGGKTCVVDGTVRAEKGKGKGKGKKGRSSQTFPCARVYLAYTVFGGPASNQRATIMTAWSDDSGTTWSVPKPLSVDLDVDDDGIVSSLDVQAVKLGRGQRCQTTAYNPALDVNVDCVVDQTDERAVSKVIGTSVTETQPKVHQGAALAVAPTTGHIYLAWRQFGLGVDTDAIFISKSTDGGQTYSAPALVSTVRPFDQGTTNTTFRTNGFPSLAIDDANRAYLAWTTRGLGTFRPDPVTGDARVVVASSLDGVTWSQPRPVDNHDAPGHQFMPSIVFSAGQLQLLYYDQREDLSGLFGPFVDELPIIGGPSPRIRHTTEVRAAHATPGLDPTFTSVQVTDYLFGVPAGGATSMRLQFDPPNLPMFRLGTTPFMGDYIDIFHSQPILHENGTARFNTAPSTSPLFHAIWTDNRDVRPPPDGDWTRYTPPNPSFTRPITSGFDPSQTLPVCTPGFVATRNQNVYTARVTSGLVAAALTNSKQLSTTLQRSFPIYVQNNSLIRRSYRLTIRTQPIGGRASLDQFSPLTSLDVMVPPRSTVARSVHVTSSDPRASVPVDIVEITAPGGTVVTGGQSGEIVLNPDRTNPDVDNPDVDNADAANPDVDNPDVDNAEVFNPDVDNAAVLGLANPDVDNPDVDNPDVDNTLVVNPSVVTADPGAPDVDNPDVDNLAFENPDVDNADLVNGGLTDTTWTMTNRGNTAASYSVKMLLNRALPPGFLSQLIVHRVYQTPNVQGCDLKQQTQNILLVNLPNPSFATASDVANPDVDNPDVDNVTVAIPPSSSIRVTLRVYDPNRFDSQTFDAATAATPAMVAHSVDSPAVALGDTTPTVAAPLLPVPNPPAAPVGSAYSFTLPAVGTGTWSIVGGQLPPGLTLDPNTGQITGTATTGGNFTFVAKFVGDNGIEDLQTVTLTVAAPAAFADVAVAISDTPDPAALGAPLTYNVLVSNTGPAQATGVAIAQSIPIGATGVSATPSQGTCTVGTMVHCTLGSIANGSSASIAVVLTPGAADFATSTVSVTTASADPVAANDSATASTLIQAFATCAAPTFSGPRIFSIPAQGNSALFVADVNSDGRLDALMSHTGSAQISVLLGDGAGNFGPATLLSGPAGLGGLAVADFNADGHADIVAATSNSSNLSVFLGDGVGGFASGTPLSAGITSVAVESGDFNNDGRIDLLVGGSTGQMAFVAGRGDGTFDPPVLTTVGAAGSVQFAIEDYNLDGLLDAATSNQGVIALLLGNGSGTFTPHVTFSPGPGTRVGQGVGDVNLDGAPDLAVTVGTGTTSQTLIYLGDGQGGFAPAIDVDAGDTGQYTSAADVTGDGFPDVVTIHPNAGGVGVQVGAGSAFANTIMFPVPVATHLRLADVNGDLKPDILTITDNTEARLSVLLNACGQPPADLVLVANDSPDPVGVGAPLTYSVSVNNNGPNPAPNVKVTASLAANGQSVVSATSSQGSCTFGNFVAQCELGTLTSGSAATLSFGATSSVDGSVFGATLGVTSDASDPVPANNAVTLLTTVSSTPGTPIIASVNPNVGQQDSTLDVVVTGSNTHFAQGQTTIAQVAGITLNSITVANPTSLTANITISPTADVGSRDVTTTTGSEVVTRTNGFSVTPGLAAVAEVVPSSGQQGQVLSVDISGTATHFAQGVTTVSLTRSGTVGAIDVVGVTVNSPTSITAQLSIASNAAAGAWSLSAITGGESATLNNAFTVVATAATITSVLPNQAQQGQTLDVIVTGQATSFVQGATTATFGPGITVNNVTVASATSATVNITIAATAFTGNRTVTMTTGTEIATSANDFAVTFGPASIAQLNPNVALQGQSLAVVVTGQGTHFEQGVTSADFGPGVALQSVSVSSATTATANITVAPSAAPGARTVTLTTQGEQASIVSGFTVQSVTPILGGANPPSALQAQTLGVIVTGQSTNFVQGTTTADFGLGIAVNTVSVTSPTSATVNITVNALAAVGPRTVTMTTGTEVATGANAFSVTSGPARIVSVTPISGDQGESLEVSILGEDTHFQQGTTTANFGSGITVNSLTVNAINSAVANISIAPLASPGLRVVSLHTQGETAQLANAFTVVAATPVITQVNPTTAQQGQTLDVAVTGQFSNFQQGVTTASFGAGITINSVTVSTPTTATVNISISPIAFTGGRTVTLTTGAESAQSAGNAFSVVAGSASITSVSPNSGQQGQTLDVTITGQGTHFSQGGSVASFGGGITVNQLLVTSQTSAIANISIAAQAAVGAQTVTVTTSGESAQLAAAFSVTAGQAAITNVTPPTGHQSETLNVQVTGQLTHFEQGTTSASFGAGIVVNSVTVNSAVTATVNITVNAAASPGSRTVTLTTGAEVASMVGGFTVLAGVPTLASVNPLVGTQGETLTVVLNGQFTNFTQGLTAVSFGSGIAVGTVTVNGPTLASVPITISAFATVGARSVTVTTGSEVATLANGFTVIAGAPSLSIIDPNIGRPNENVTVSVTGEFTNFQNGVTVASFGPDVSVGGAAAGALGGVTVSNATHFTAQLFVAPGAQLGPRDVVVQTGTESITVVGGFTVTNVESIPPSVFKVSPLSSATDVPLNARVQVEFSEPIDRTTVTPASFVLRDNTTFTPVPATVSVDVTGRLATLIPTQLLAVNRNYSVLLSAGPQIKDAAGNPMSVNSPSTFTTGFATDTSGPSFLTISPAQDATDVPLNADIVVEFNKPLNPISQPLGLQVQLNGEPLPGTYTFSAGNRIVTFQPTSLLTASTAYTVVLSDQLSDAAGFSLANPTIVTFITGTTSDTVNPVVTASNPRSGSTDVGLNTVLRVTFSERIDPISAVTGFVRVFPSATFVPVQAVVTVASDRRSLTLTPVEPLRGDTAYIWQVFSLRDLAGGTLGSFSISFTTGTNFDTSAPAVTHIAPLAGATDVPVNTRVLVQLSEAVDPTSLSGGVQLTPSVPGTITLIDDANDDTVMFVPSGPLAASTTYNLAVTGLRDLTGNVMTSFASSFTTRVSAVADTTAPTVVTITPLQGATGVSTTSPIVFTISEPILASAVDDASVQVFASVNSILMRVAGSYSVNSTATVITFTPLTPYPGNTNIFANINSNGAIDDLAGNNLSSVQRMFTTAAGADTTAPTIVGVMPVDGTLNVGLNAVVTLTFSESLATGTVNNTTFDLYANGERLHPSVNRSLDNRTVTLTASLPPNSLITVVATSGVTDLSGNALADFTSTFTTGPAFDTTAASVLTMQPSSGVSNVPATTPLTLYLTAPVEPDTVPSALWVAQNGVLITGTISLSGNSTAIHFVPSVPFVARALVQVFLEGAVDTSGNAVPAFQASFTVANDPLTATPSVVRVSPTGTDAPRNAVIEVEFSEPINRATATAATVRLLDQSFQPIPTQIGFRADDRIIRLTPQTLPLAAGQTHFIQVQSGLQDLQGQALPPGLFSFTTGTTSDTTAPLVAAVTPPNGTTNIGINGLIRVRFSEPINPLTVSAATSTIQVTAGAFVVVPSSISFNFGDTEVTLAPVQPFPDATVLTITINGVEDRAGNAVTPVTTTFTTRIGADTERPTLTLASVTNAQTDVPVNSVFVGDFNEPLDPQSVTTLSVVLRDNVTFITVPSLIALNPDGHSITITPNSALPVGRSFSLFFTGLRDLAGNQSLPTSVSFTTSFQSDVTAPAVRVSNPVTGDIAVPTNVRLEVLFDESIDADRLDEITLSNATSQIPVSATLSNGNRTLNLVTATLLAPSTPHTLALAGIRDLSGNQMAATSIAFTTGAGADLVSGSVASSNPESGATDVGVNAVLRAVFSERVDPLSVATGLIRVIHVATFRTQAAVVTLAADRRSLTLTLTEPLVANTQYSWQVLNLRDLAGNAINSLSVLFTTAAATDTTAPTITHIAPVTGATDVPVNARVIVRLSEAVDPTSIPGAVQLTPSVTGSLTQSTDNRTLTFVPTGLSAATNYSVTVSGLRDLTGNTMTPFASSFVTRSIATPDTTAPTATISPAQGAINVAIDSPIVITTSEPILASAVNESSVAVYATVDSALIRVAGTYSVNATATEITYQPIAPYPGNTVIRVDVNGNGSIDDLAGNNLTFATRTFTTVAAADTTPPTVVSVTPPNGTVNVGLNAVVTLTFAESLAPATVSGVTFELFAGVQQLNPGVSRSVDNRTVTLTATLPPNTLITVVATRGVTDLAGNALADFTSTFTTGPAVDASIGHVVTVRPASGATNVPRTTPVTLYLTKPVQEAGGSGTLWVSQNGVLIAGTVSVSGNGTAIHFVPAAPFAASALIQVFLDGVVDVAGNAVTSFQASFVTANDPVTTTPSVLRVSPSGTAVPLNPVIEVEISEPLNPATAIAPTVRLLNQSFQEVATTAPIVRADNRIVRLTLPPSTFLTASQTHFIQVQSGLQDLQGQALPPGLFSFATGTTADGTPPTVAAVTPPNGAASIGINALVRVRFSERINPLTVSATTIQITSGGFVAVPASISFNTGDTEVTITPVQPLPDATTLTITINGVEDLAGQAVTPQTTTFTTRTGIDIQPPTLTGVSVFNSQTGVPVNSVFVGEFDEPFDPQSVNPQSVTLRDNVTFTTVPATVALNPDGRSVTLTPTSALVVSRSYTLFFNFNSVLRDLAGNQAVPASVSFTTSTASDTTPPTVVLTSPTNNLTGVPTNTRLEVLFDEPVDATRVDQVHLMQGGSPIPVTRSLTNGNRTVTLTPATLLAPNASYTISVSEIFDTAGNAMLGVTTASFTTGSGADLTPPGVTAFAPLHNTTGVPVGVAPQVTFDDAINPLTVLNNVVLRRTATSVIVPVSYGFSADLKTITLMPSASLEVGTQYTIAVISNVRDLAGNLAPSSSATFTTQ